MRAKSLLVPRTVKKERRERENRDSREKEKRKRDSRDSRVKEGIESRDPSACAL